VNVLLENSYYSGGDDAICIQSGSTLNGRRFGRPTRNVTVRKMTIGVSHGITVGNPTAAGVSNVLFEDIEMTGSLFGGEGGVVQNITYSNIRLKNVRFAIMLSQNYYEKAPADVSATPVLKNVVINGLVSDGAVYGYWLDGLPENLIYGLSLSNIHLSNTANLILKCNYIVGVCDSGSVSPSCPSCL
jgi:polygalacturonase